MILERYELLAKAGIVSINGQLTQVCRKSGTHSHKW